jgi:pilus assembly protein CpaE
VVNKSLLIIDTDDSFSNKLKLEIEKRSAKVWIAKNSRKILEGIVENIPDLILCSDKLAGQNSKEIIRMLRKNPTCNRVPIILLVTDGNIKKIEFGRFAGINEAVSKKNDFSVICDTVNQVLETKERTVVKEMRQKDHLLTILSARGGSGKTALATNIGVGLTEFPAETVALVDLNLEFGVAALMLNLRTNFSLLEITAAVLDEVKDAELDSMLIHHSTGLRVLPAPSKAGESEKINDKSLQMVIQRLVKLYDHVVIDGRPSYRDIMLDLWEQSSSLLVTCPPTVISVAVTGSLFEAFKSVHVDSEKIELIVNHLSSYVGLAIEQVQGRLQKTTTVIPYGGKNFEYCEDMGKVFITEYPKEPTAKAIRALVQKLFDRQMYFRELE